jgi:hypothetical protein
LHGSRSWNIAPAGKLTLAGGAKHRREEL